MARSFKLVVTAAISFVSFGMLTFLSLQLEPPSSQAETRISPPPSVVVSRPIMRELVEQREFAGRFEASAAVDIRARVSGHLQSISISDGDLVEAGQLLFTIDPRPYQVALDAARAQFASAVAQAELADLELARAERLIDSATVTQAVLDQRRHQKRAAEAAQAIAAAELQRAEINLAFTEVRAPFRGRTSYRRLDVGALVSEGAMLTSIVALDPVYFVFDISEHDLLAYRDGGREGGLPDIYSRGARVEIRTQGDQGQSHSGVIDFIDNRLQEGAGTIRIRARLRNGNQDITPGQFGRLRLPFSGSYTAMLVPETALVADQAQRVLLTVSTDGTVRSSQVDLGPRLPDGMRIIRNGIAPDDQIITSGLLRARPGQKVMPQIDQPAARTASADKTLTN